MPPTLSLTANVASPWSSQPFISSHPLLTPTTMFPWIPGSQEMKWSQMVCFRSFHLFVPQFFHLQNGTNNIPT